MLASLLIVFREVIEAGLIVGIVMAATRGVPGRGRWVSYGIGAGIVGACIVALFANSISAAMEGFGQEWFNIIVLSAAVLMLAWHNVWMARHGREIAMHMKAVGEEVIHGKRSLVALGIVVALAVLREGSEVVLFLYGIAIAGKESVFAMTSGSALGLLLGVAVGTVTYFGLVHIPSKYLFRVTGWMIALLAAGMAAQAASLLQQAQVIELLPNVVWNTSGFISDSSFIGKALATLIGYTSQPTGLQLAVYLITLATIFALMRLFGHAPAHQKAPLPVS